MQNASNIALLFRPARGLLAIMALAMLIPPILSPSIVHAETSSVTDQHTAHHVAAPMIGCLFELAISNTEQITDEDARGQVLRQIVDAQLHAGGLTDALETARGIARSQPRAAFLKILKTHPYAMSARAPSPRHSPRMAGCTPRTKRSTACAPRANAPGQCVN